MSVLSLELTVQATFLHPWFFQRETKRVKKGEKDITGRQLGEAVVGGGGGGGVGNTCLMLPSVLFPLSFASRSTKATEGLPFVPIGY